MHRISIAMLSVLALAGCHKTPPAAVAPVSPSDLASLIGPSLKPKEPGAAGPEGWDQMAKALSGPAHSKEDQGVMGNAIVGKIDDSLASRAQERLKGFDADINALEAPLKQTVWLAPTRKVGLEQSVLLEKQRAIQRAMCFRGRIRLYSHKPGGADDLLAAYAVGDRMIRSNGRLLELRTGLAEKALANRSIQQAVLDNECTPKDLETLANGLSNADPDGVELANAFRLEFAEVFTSGVAKVSYGEPAAKTDDAELGIAQVQPQLEAILQGNAHPFDRSQTIKDAEPIVQSLVASATGPWSANDSTDTLVAKQLAGWPSKLYKTQEALTDDEIETAQKDLQSIENPFGKFIVGSLARTWEGDVQVWFKTRADSAATRIIVAAERYRKQSAGRLPASLAALHDAKLLTATPTDPFGTQPLQFAADRKLFWSIGPNAKDDGGKDQPGSFSGVKDYVYKLPGDGGYR